MPTGRSRRLRQVIQLLTTLGFTDGSHRYEAVLADIALARALAADECVMAFDDFSNLGHLGVAAAVWPSVVSSEVEPFACTPTKLYATLEKRYAPAYREAVETFASERGNEIRRTDFFWID